MNFIDVWMTTIIVNFICSINTNFQIYKLLGDKGYIYKRRKFKEIERRVYEDDEFLPWLLYVLTPIIPIYNVYDTIIKKYLFYQENNIDILYKNNIIEKMTTSEIEKYNKNRTGLRARKLEIMMYIKRRNSYCIILSDGSSIHYNYNDKVLEEDNLLNSINIIEARGALENKKEEELIKIVYDSHIKVAEELLDKCESPDKFLEEHDNYEQENTFSSKEEINIEKRKVLKKIKKK